MDEEQQLSKHKRRLLKLQHKKEARERLADELQKAEQTKKFKFYGAIALAVLGLAALFIFWPKSPPTTINSSGLVFPLTNIHWHATPKVFVCGENIPIPVPLSAEQHIGSSVLHTHPDALIHMEGTFANASHMTIGLFMSNIGMKFTDTQLQDKKNGDSCNGNTGIVKLIVNGKENNELSNYVIRDSDIIEMRFE